MPRGGGGLAHAYAMLTWGVGGLSACLCKQEGRMANGEQKEERAERGRVTGLNRRDRRNDSTEFSWDNTKNRWFIL